MGADEARILLTRTGFGAAPAEIAAFAKLTRGQGVDRLLAATVAHASTPLPVPLDDPASARYPGKDASADARKAFRREQASEALALRAWWMREMLVTPSPLTERMTLFWHGHFATSVRKVRLAPLMARQNATLRAHATGDFRALLHAVARDPAMLVYLDGVQNRRGHPNENFARELMELFTLGEGHYTEDDVKEAARAFTGWGIDRDSGSFVARPRLHDDGVKTVLGRTGRLDGDAVVEAILADPQSAVFITSLLWKEFVSPTPDTAEVARIAGAFRASGYDIKAVLRALFASDAMYAEAARATLTRSPVDLVIGTLHTLDMLPGDMRPYAVACAGMGQGLFAPPNVKGWPGGEAWINSDTLLARKQFLARLARSGQFGLGAPAVAGPGMMQAAGPAEGSFDAARWLAAAPHGEADARMRTLAILLPQAPVASDAIFGDVPNVVRTALQDATYQLE